LFCTVTTFAALVVFTTWVPNDSVEGDKPTGITPDPVSCAVCGEFGALSLTVSVPKRDPTTVGVKVTEIVQVSFAANVFGDNGQFEVWAKSPEVEIPAMVRGTVWLFCNVRTLTALVAFTDWLPNASDEGDKATGTAPVPVNCVVCGEFGALSLTVNVPVR